MKRLLLGLALLATACGAENETSALEAQTGTARLELVATSASGTSYRLRSARLRFTGAEGPTVLRPGDDAVAAIIDLPTGEYQMLLQDGWRMERLEARGVYANVRAQLESPNPVSFVVREGTTTRLELLFSAGDEFIAMGQGRVEVRINVNDGTECPPECNGQPVLCVGRCDVVCPPGCQPEPDPAGCPVGSVDLDGDPANGCEYACLFGGDADTPDRQYIDRNCDGVEGTAAQSVFVAPAPLGSAQGDGTLGSPVDTITEGIRIAELEGLTHVLVAEGTYGERVDLSDGINVYGGYQPNGPYWPRRAYVDSPTPTRVDFHTTAITATGLSTITVLDNLVIEAPAPFDGFASIAAVRVHASTLWLQDSKVIAGQGGIANNGRAGDDGASGGAGFAGANGIENSSNEAPGGQGATGCGIGGQGGNGGDGGYFPAWGVSGAQGQPGSFPGCLPRLNLGAGGQGGVIVGCEIIVPPESGEDGAISSAPCAGGRGGVGGTWSVEAGWLAESGRSGERGGDGSGGGGGGGDAESACLFDIEDRAAAGGGGGGGGCGGDAGRGGDGGGASFGVLASGASAVVAVNCDIVAADGGDGGDGGVGGQGGVGGIGGLGGASAIDEHRGGDGGDGGAGGDGTCGGGGAGGHSYAIFLVGDSGFEPIGGQLSFGAAGQGGSSPCALGQAGQDGTAGDIGSM